MRKLLLAVLVCALSAGVAGGAYGGWFDDFEAYTMHPDNPTGWWQGWASPGGQQVWFRETLDTGNIYNTRMVDTEIGGNATQKIVGEPWNYGSTFSRYIGDYGPTDPIIVTAQVASTALHSSWPLICAVWVDGVALGISGNRIAYGLMPLGQKVDAGNFAALMTKVGPTIAADTWYDVKIEVNQGQGATNNDVVDLYYKAATGDEWTTIITGLDTGTTLGQDAKVAMKIANDAHRGYIDNVGVVVVPEPATMGLLALGAAALVSKRRKA